MSKSRYYPGRRNDRAWGDWQHRSFERRDAIGNLDDEELEGRYLAADAWIEAHAVLSSWDRAARNDGRRRDQATRDRQYVAACLPSIKARYSRLLADSKTFIQPEYALTSVVKAGRVVGHVVICTRCHEAYDQAVRDVSRVGCPCRSARSLWFDIRLPMEVPSLSSVSPRHLMSGSVATSYPSATHTDRLPNRSRTRADSSQEGKD